MENINRNSDKNEIYLQDGRLFCRMSKIVPTTAPTESYPDKHSHSLSSIALVSGGTGIFENSNREYPIKSGDIIVIRSMEPHHIFSNSYNTLELIDVAFSPIPIMPPNSEWIEKRLSNLFFSLDKNFSNILPEDNPYCVEIAHIIHYMYNEFSNNTPNLYMLKAKFLEILSRLPQIIDIDSLSDNGNATKYTMAIANSIAYINSNLTKDISLTKIAKYANMEVSRFSEIFKAFQGVSPWNYVLNARIKLAKNYLKENECYYSIMQIASMTGFENLSNFNRVFKSTVGMTPSEYRKSFGKNKA